MNEEINSLKDEASMCDVNGESIVDGGNNSNKFWSGS